ADLTVELAIRELAHITRLALPDQRDLVVILAIAMAVEAGLDDVHPAPDPPFRPLLAVGQVDDLVVVAIERDVDVLDRRVPEPLDVLVGARQQLDRKST